MEAKSVNCLLEVRIIIAHLPEMLGWSHLELLGTRHLSIHGCISISAKWDTYFLAAG